MDIDLPSSQSIYGSVEKFSRYEGQSTSSSSLHLMDDSSDEVSRYYMESIYPPALQPVYSFTNEFMGSKTEYTYTVLEVFIYQMVINTLIGYIEEVGNNPQLLVDSERRDLVIQKHLHFLKARLTHPDIQAVLEKFPVFKEFLNGIEEIENQEVN